MISNSHKYIIKENKYQQQLQFQQYQLYLINQSIKFSSYSNTIDTIIFDRASKNCWDGHYF